VRLLESHIVAREAMKPPSGQSALNGDVNNARTSEVANETLNEMQRNRGGDTVQEDESLYQVTLRRPDSTGASDWTGEVTGPPSVLSLKTVNVLTAGKTVIVFDKSNKKLWQAALTYNVAGGNHAANGEASPFGEGPCAERGDTLYVIDQAVLTAFDLATGNVRWRLPSVGVVGLFFDDKGMLYVNTTTADPESIKYSRQIDITKKIDAILLKIDPQSGKTLWTTKPGGFISYLSGNFIYTVEIYDPGEEANRLADIAGITPTPPRVQIRRINPKDGQVLWEHDQERAPLDVRFKDNYIQIVFKKEVQVLKFFSF
jgi:outer membrane protein assembly factor BamB